MDWTWQTSAIGLGVGLVTGLTGMGAGSLLTPLLILLLGIDPFVAVGTSLAHAGLMKAVGTWQHARMGTVDWAKVRWLALGSVPAVLAAAGVLAVMKASDAQAARAFLSRWLGAALVTAAAAFAWRAFGSASRGRWLEGERGIPHLVVAGTWVGTLVGITSIGSGSVLIPVLSHGTGLAAAGLVGTDLAHALLLMAAGGAAHACTGNVSWPLAAGLLAGSAPGIWIGSRTSVRLPQPVVHTAMAAMLLTAGLRVAVAGGLR